MRMRMFPILILAAATLAGCADTPDAAVDDTVEPVLHYDPAGLVSSHPAYGYLTNEALLEAPAPGVIYEDINGTRVWYNPAHAGLDDVLSGFDHLAVKAVDGGGHGIYVFGSLVLTGGTGGPMSIFDVSDPASPELIGTSADTPVRDADVILYPDGRLVAITSSGGKQVVATDITDPTAPAIASTIDTPGSDHNIAVVPGAPIVYNSGMDIVDFTDPENPEVAGAFPDTSGGCHDIAFYINQTGNTTWALCAGYAETEIWDIADPFAPVLVNRIPFPSVNNGIPVVGSEVPDDNVPALPGSISHLAIMNHDGTVLIMGDETGGGAINGCDFYADAGEMGTYSGPSGNLWFYDVSDPENPVLHGHVSPGAYDADGSCTAHFGKVIEDTSYVVMSFYAAGIVLVDFDDLDNPRIVDRYDELAGQANVWDVQYHQGYLFTGDMNRGMDVLQLA